MSRKGPRDRTKTKPKPKSTGTYVAGMGTGPQVAAAISQGDVGTKRNSIQERINNKRWHPEWSENYPHWRHLQDSLEGGERYRNAVYGMDRKGMPVRNLLRHRREYPDPQQFPASMQGVGATAGMIDNNPIMNSLNIGPFPGMLGSDPGTTAQDDDYEFRRSRTPIPEFLPEAVDIHLSKVYKQEVSRAGPANLVEWWEDVDGRGTAVDDWMEETVAPLLLAVGVLDLCFDHPMVPEGEKVETKADEQRLGLDRCVVSYILPENVVWWKLDSAGRYAECIVMEYADPADRNDFDENGKPIKQNGKDEAASNWLRNYVRFRHWTATESTLYTYTGDVAISTLPHSYGRVPIVRLMAIKRHRSPHIAKPFYENVAALQRAFYNLASELEFSNTIQAHPVLSGPEDYLKGDNTLSVGPNNVLPKKKNSENGTYEGWDFVSPPKNPADSLRTSLLDFRDTADRRAALTKPAGVMGRTGGVVGQSGLSKQLDAVTGNDLLAKIAKILARAERDIAEFALLCLNGAKPEKDVMDTVEVTYPSTFELFGADEILGAAVQFQAVMAASGNAPEAEFEILTNAFRKMMPGLSDEDYQTIDDEIWAGLEARSTIKMAEKELRAAGIESAHDALGGDGDAESGSERDPTGVSQGTMVSGIGASSGF